MDKKEQILDILNSNEEIFDGAFLDRKAADEEIAKTEQELGFKIPDSYIWFLKEIGHGGFFFEFMGYGKNDVAIFAAETLKQRENGLPENLLIIQNCDEYFDCLNISTGNVVSWSIYDNDGVIDKEMDFYDFFIECLENAIDSF